MTNDLPDGLRTQIRFLTADNGSEMLWAEHLSGDSYRILSVPVFVYGTSRGAIVTALADDAGNLFFNGLRQESDGATVRLYVLDHLRAGKLYSEQVLPRAAARGVAIGPATILDPAIVGINLASRSEWRLMAALLDEMVAENHVRFWELGDPDLSPAIDDAFPSPGRAPWHLVHPPPGDPITRAVRDQ